MNNVIDFSQRKKSKQLELASPIDRVNEIFKQSTASERTDIIKKVKQILQSKSVKYRITHEDVNSKIAHKSKSILFIDIKCGFILGDKEKSEVNKNGWIFEFIKISNKKPIDIVNLILNSLEVKNAKT